MRYFSDFLLLLKTAQFGKSYMGYVNGVMQCNLNPGLQVKQMGISLTSSMRFDVLKENKNTKHHPIFNL